jgi:hypothetical protein
MKHNIKVINKRSLYLVVSFILNVVLAVSFGRYAWNIRQERIHAEYVKRMSYMFPLEQPKGFLSPLSDDLEVDLSGALKFVDVH